MSPVAGPKEVGSNAGLMGVWYGALPYGGDAVGRDVTETQIG
jgi:hypothetical protein